MKRDSEKTCSRSAFAAMSVEREREGGVEQSEFQLSWRSKVQP